MTLIHIKVTWLATYHRKVSLLAVAVPISGTSGWCHPSHKWWRIHLILCSKAIPLIVNGLIFLWLNATSDNFARIRRYKCVETIYINGTQVGVYWLTEIRSATNFSKRNLELMVDHLKNWWLCSRKDVLICKVLVSHQWSKCDGFKCILFNSIHF
jgi:hypothetical protein